MHELSQWLSRVLKVKSPLVYSFVIGNNGPDLVKELNSIELEKLNISPPRSTQPFHPGRLKGAYL